VIWLAVDMQHMQTQHLANLIVVCCHATFRGDNFHPYDEASWILQDFQRPNMETGKIGEHHTFIEHINAGISLHSQDPSALLLFSGGRTQTQVDTSEAESYSNVEPIMSTPEDLKEGGIRLWPDWRGVETHATDSMQNLLFSILRFRKLTGIYPMHVTIVTHAFKERRFLELHGPAIRYPAERLRVCGINPPMTLTELQDVQEGELKRGYGPFLDDPYGAGEVLSGKRAARGWKPATIEKLADGLEDEVKRLLEWTGGANGKETFNERLPWECDQSNVTEG
jgi:hypothetical protein